MEIVIDLNIIFSALIKDSITRKIILESGFYFYFPKPSLDKIIKYKGYIIEKSGLSEKEFFELLEILFTKIRLIEEESLLENWSVAKSIMEAVDPEDVVFIAAALGLKEPGVWSNDPDFEGQERVRIFKTKDVINLLKNEETL